MSTEDRRAKADNSDDRRKKANGEGTIGRRADGRYQGRYTIVDRSGRRHRISVYGSTREDVAKQLRRKLVDRDRGRSVAPTRETLGEHLGEWLESEKPNLAPMTWQAYESISRMQLVPRLGSIALSRLRPQQVQALLGDLLAEGKSPKTARNVHGALHAALQRAVEWELIADNPASEPRVKLPKRDPRDMHTLSAEEVRAVLVAAQEDELCALWTAMLTTGMRQGELLALRWRDVDLEAGRLHVVASSVRLSCHARELLGVATSEPLRRDPKTKRGMRVVELPQLAVDAFREHRRQVKVLELTGRVFNRPDRRALAVPTLYTRWHALLKRAGVPRVRPHDARHTVATLLLGAGENPKIVQELLGHSTVAITMDVYSHATPTMHREAARKLDGLLGTPLQQAR
ncbi:MAG: tyrosine-type recombinase/integrase [Candidatus Dormibacteria bacterium]